MGEKLKELLKKPIFWIAIAGVALFAIIRSRASSARSADDGAAPAPFMGGGGGSGAPVSGGTSIQDQLAQQDLAGLQQQLAQQGALFNFDLQQKQRMADLMMPLQQAWEKTQEALQGNQTLLAGKIGEQIKATKSQCAHGDAKIDPETGQLYCRTPEGGGFKPFQQIGDIIGGNLTGVKNVFAGIWQGAAAAAPGITQGYLGQLTGFPSVPTGGGQSKRQGKPAPSNTNSYQGIKDTPLGGISGMQFKVPQMPTFPELY